MPPITPSGILHNLGESFDPTLISMFFSFSRVEHYISFGGQKRDGLSGLDGLLFASRLLVRNG